MGQKINPKLFRLGNTTTWSSRWFDDKHYAKFLLADYHIRAITLKKFKRAVADIDIERTGTNLIVNVSTARPGVIIGRGGAGVEELKNDIKKIAGGNVTVNIVEIKNPEGSAAVIANSIVEQIEKRIPFRRALKQSLESAKQARVEGAKVTVAGRLNGAEIARTESLSYGKIPLHTIKHHIDYAARTALTTYGTIGVKVWISPRVEEETNN